MVSIVCVDVLMEPRAPVSPRPVRCKSGTVERGTVWDHLISYDSSAVQCRAAELSGKMVLRFLKICCSAPVLRPVVVAVAGQSEGCWRTVVETALPLPGYHRPQITESNLYPTHHTKSTTSTTTLTTPPPLNTFISQQSVTSQ